MKHRFARKILNDKSGQMAIFIAIIFQVLFVLFAMSINVALVVHDKVNLQNAVDLAAYYGAQKQAEMLNVIAHQNYQVRQAWKLLSWRYRVLGQYGVGGHSNSAPIKHPARLSAASRDSEDDIFYPNTSTDDPVKKETPIVCTGFAPNWKPKVGPDNLCSQRDFNVPNFPPPASVAIGSASLQQAVNAGFGRAAEIISNNCKNAVALNYMYAASILGIFRVEQKARRELIYGLLNQMQSSTGGFIDLNGDSVEAGVAQMVTKNLTYSNQSQAEVSYYNSLGGRSISDFFAPIEVTPNVLFVESGAGGASATCSFSNLDAKPVHLGLTPGNLAINAWLNYDPNRNLAAVSEYNHLQNSLFQHSVGIEKNPWSWVYSGVVAKTKTRPIFFPIGEPLTITARAFAKPFGGRVGPWYSETWAPGASRSGGGAKVDKLLPFRVGENGETVSVTELRRDTTAFPNFSRYPGDENGYRAHLGLNSIKDFKDLTVGNFAHFNTLKKMWTSNADSVVEDNDNTKLREYEIAAIAPDLFDATYYSIEPEFSKVYMPKLIENKEKILKASSLVQNITQIKVRGDHGSQPDKAIDVIDQINISNSKRNDATYYYINEPKHLLTAWLHGLKALDFSDANTKAWFANCEPGADSYSYGEDKAYKIPGGCIKSGGRTGYSVKLFSGKIFSRSDLALGGVGASSGPINNSPPASFWQ